MKWPRWIEVLSTHGIILLAMLAGLAASYGRELDARRKPGRRWWVRRLLVLPLLAITAAAASETFALSRTLSAFTAAMLSLGSYDVLRLIEARWRARIDPDPGKEATR